MKHDQQKNPDQAGMSFRTMPNPQSLPDPQMLVLPGLKFSDLGLSYAGFSAPKVDKTPLF